MTQTIKNYVDKKEIMKKLNTCMNKASIINIISLEETKTLLNDIEMIEAFFLENDSKIKKGLERKCVDLITNLREKLYQLYEDRLRVEYNSEKDYINDENFNDLSIKEQNSVLANEIIKEYIEKEYSNIKKIAKKYQGLVSTQKKRKTKINKTNFIKDKIFNMKSKLQSKRKSTHSLVPKKSFLGKISNKIKYAMGDIEVALFRIGQLMKNSLHSIKVCLSKTKKNRDKKRQIKKQKHNNKRLAFKAYLVALMMALGISGFIAKTTYNNSPKTDNKKVEKELEDDEIINIEDLREELDLQKEEIPTIDHENSQIDIKEEPELPIIEEFNENIEEDNQIVITNKNEQQAEILEEEAINSLLIGTEIELLAGSSSYSNMYDAYFNDNELTPYYSADSMPRTVNSIVVSNGEELKNIKTNEELSTYIDNNYEIIGCSVTNQYSQNNTVEGFYRIENIKNDNSKNIQKTLM